MHWQSSVSSPITVEPMARLSCITLIIAMNVLMCVLAEESLNSDQYEIDVRALLENKKLLEDYYNCIMEIAPCKTPEQKRIKGTAIYTFNYFCFFCNGFFSQYEIDFFNGNIEVSIVLKKSVCQIRDFFYELSIRREKT